MTNHAADPQLLTDQIRWAMSRGLPPQVAEDVVFGAWGKAQHAFDPSRGELGGLLHTIVRRDCAQWWRDQAREERGRAQLRLVSQSPDASAEEEASQRRDALLAALTPDERAVFDAWALQRHLGKGQTTGAEVARSIGLSERDYENAKRRLKVRLLRLLDEAGATPRELFHGVHDAG